MTNNNGYSTHYVALTLSKDFRALQCSF